MTEPLLCSQGGVPYNKAHLDAKDAEITRICRAMTAVVEENWRLRAALKPFAYYAKLNDLRGRDPAGAIEVGVGDMLAALDAYEQSGEVTK